MRARAAVFLALVALCASASSAGARTFTVLTPAAQELPGATQPNSPGSVTIPFALSRPPAQPAVLSYDQLRDLWQRAGAAYDVPWQVLAAINKVESNFGRNMGPSSAGAIGWMQFMPSTWTRWGLDADGDGVADPWDPDDAMFAAARYLAAAGGRNEIARAVFAYNHADWYVREVLDLASQFDSGNGGFSPDLGSSTAALKLSALQLQLDDARVAVESARHAIPHIRAKVDGLERQRLLLARRAGDPTIPARKFERLETRITRIERAKNRASSLAERRGADLDAAQAQVQSLQEQIAQAAVASPAAVTGAGTQASDGYVFPVGGGPQIVSVGHHHHDYPAADIAAPEGSPLYALADSVVIDTYASGNCGTGLKLLLSDGNSYTYCHMSYLDPSVTPGAALNAGDPVGRVGHTGDASGPHLHLQLNPATRYPQREPWFQSFAGIAFSWQDARTPKRHAAKPRGRVFTVEDAGGDPFAGGVITFTR